MLVRAGPWLGTWCRLTADFPGAWKTPRCTPLPCGGCHADHARRGKSRSAFPHIAARWAAGSRWAVVFSASARGRPSARGVNVASEP